MTPRIENEARIDVLAVMDAAANAANDVERAEQIAEARTAVARLISTVREFQRRRSASAEEAMYSALARIGEQP